MSKIAIILYYFDPYKSGLSEYSKHIAKELVQQGHQVDVITSKFDSNLQDQEVIEGVSVSRKKTWFGFGKGVFVPGIIWEVFTKRDYYDKFFFFLPYAESFIFPLFIDQSKIYTFYVCDINIGSPLIEKILFLSMKFLASNSKKVITLSTDYYKNCKITSTKIDSKQIGLFPYVEYDKPPVYQGVDYRNKYGIPAEAFVIGFLGRIVYEKGIDYLLDAFKKYHDKYDSESYLLIGGDYQNVRGGSVYGKLKQKIEALGKYVIVTGFVPEKEKNDFFKAMNVFVLPSIDPLEAFGIVQIEAMKNGIPVIASDLPGVREVVNNTNFGFVAKRSDVNDLLKKIVLTKTDKHDVMQYKHIYKNFYNKKIWLEKLYKIIEE